MAITKESAEFLRTEGFKNPIFFLKMFLADWFPGRVPWVHRGIAAIYSRQCAFLQEFDEEYTQADLGKIVRHFVWTDKKTQETTPLFRFNAAGKLVMEVGLHTLIMLPRGFSKTTLLMGLETWAVCYQETDFDLLVSATQGHADGFLAAVAGQIETNVLIKDCFGSLKPAQRGGVKWSASGGEINTITGVSLRSKGAGAQIRGQNINGKRPKRIVIDDLEDRETVSTEDQRAKLKQWYFTDLKYALPRLVKDASMLVLGTLLHREALTTVLMADPLYNVVVFGALDPDGDPLWEEAMSLEEVEAERAAMAGVGLLSQFYLELFNEIRGNTQDSIREEHIRVEARNPSEAVLLAIALDPAISKKTKADFASIAVVGMMPGGTIHLFDIWMKKGASPRELVNEYFALRIKWGLSASSKHGVESNAYQAALVHLLQEEMFRKSAESGAAQYFEVIPITHNTDKILRIKGVLHPRYISGYITHQMAFGEYLTQLLDFPNGKLDGPDSVAMAITLLDGAAAIAGGDTVGEDSYEPLHKLIGNYRRY